MIAGAEEVTRRALVLRRPETPVHPSAHEPGARETEMRIKAVVELTVSESGVEDAMEEYDDLTVEGILTEILDKSIACDEVTVKVTEGPNTLEEFDQQQAEVGA